MMRTLFRNSNAVGKCWIHWTVNVFRLIFFNPYTLKQKEWKRKWRVKIIVVDNKVQRTMSIGSLVTQSVAMRVRRYYDKIELLKKNWRSKIWTRRPPTADTVRFISTEYEGRVDSFQNSLRARMEFASGVFGGVFNQIITCCGGKGKGPSSMLPAADSM